MPDSMKSHTKLEISVPQDYLAIILIYRAFELVWSLVEILIFYDLMRFQFEFPKEKW